MSDPPPGLLLPLQNSALVLHNLAMLFFVVADILNILELNGGGAPVAEVEAAEVVGALVVHVGHEQLVEPLAVDWRHLYPLQNLLLLQEIALLLPGIEAEPRVAVDQIPQLLLEHLDQAVLLLLDFDLHLAQHLLNDVDLSMELSHLRLDGVHFDCF